MSTYWNDLPPLEDITETLDILPIEKFTDKDIEEFKMSILYFIEDFVLHNIKLYKDKYYEDIVFDSIYSIVTDAYQEVLFANNYDIDIKLNSAGQLEDIKLVIMETETYEGDDE